MDEVVGRFRVGPERGELWEEVSAAYLGTVVAEGRANHDPELLTAMKSEKAGAPLKPESVNDAREDKLATAFLCDSYAKRRFLKGGLCIFDVRESLLG